MIKLPIFGILYTSAVIAVLVANSVIPRILPSISIILAFKSVFLAKSLVLGIFLSTPLTFFSKSGLSVSYVVFKTNHVVSILSTFVTNLLYSVFLASFFTTLFNLAKSTETFFNL